MVSGMFILGPADVADEILQAQAVPMAKYSWKIEELLKAMDAFLKKVIEG